MTNIYNDLESFQNGVDTIVTGCTVYGSTPINNTPSKIVESIKNIYTNRYNTGVSDTKKGNATAAQVLSGKTFTNASSVNITGTMVNNGAVSKTFTPSASSQSYTIPEGYHNGSGKVTCNAVSDPFQFTFVSSSGYVTTKKYTGLTVGKTYLLVLSSYSDSGYENAIEYCEITSCTGASFSKITYDVQDNACSTYYKLIPTASTVTVKSTSIDYASADYFLFK